MATGLPTSRQGDPGDPKTTRTSISREGLLTYIVDIEQQYSSKWQPLGDSQVVPLIKNPPANAGEIRDNGLIPRSGDPME